MRLGFNQFLLIILISFLLFGNFQRIKNFFQKLYQDNFKK
jgi:Sec-independent protein translocase protein TatA